MSRSTAIPRSSCVPVDPVQRPPTVRVPRGSRPRVTRLVSNGGSQAESLLTARRHPTGPMPRPIDPPPLTCDPRFVTGASDPNAHRTRRPPRAALAHAPPVSRTASDHTYLQGAPIPRLPPVPGARRPPSVPRSTAHHCSTICGCGSDRPPSAIRSAVPESRPVGRPRSHRTTRTEGRDD